MGNWVIPPEDEAGGKSPVIAFFNPANDLIVCENLTERRKLLEIKFNPQLSAAFNPKQKAEICEEIVYLMANALKHPLIRLAQAGEEIP